MDNDLKVGLTSKEAHLRLAENGFNELSKRKTESTLAIAFRIIKEPMFLLLLACGSIYLFLGDVQEAIMLLMFIFIIIGMTLYQERRTEHALEALKDMASPTALVIRNSKEHQIPARELVVGDIVMLSEGDKIPADGVILTCSNLQVEESLLTGESFPVRKTEESNISEEGEPGGDGQSMVYAGTLVVKGHSTYEVTKTGHETEIGKIGTSLDQLTEGKTLIQEETGTIVKKLAIGSVIFCIILVVIYGLIYGKWVAGFLAGLTLAISLIPEEFPMILAIFFTMGAWRMSKQSVLTRRLAAIETLGAATVLCVDKTGTLTKNEMAISQIVTDDKILLVDDVQNVTEDVEEILHFGILACQENPFDPMEKAFFEAGKKFFTVENVYKGKSLEKEFDLSDRILAVTQIWKQAEGDYLVASKGAPESIAELCHMKETEKQSLLKQVSEMAQEGLRVLAVARGKYQGRELPENQHDLSLEFLGLVGLSDPIRASVPPSVLESYEAGIRVVMITGDYPETALQIAKKIGLHEPLNIMTGSDIKKLDDSHLKKVILNINIFARVIPEQKLRIVNALKARGDIVAMTGDGVNDAPALKAANIGIAMGERGTQVAREASDIILVKDDFTTIVNAVRMGRRIYDNIKKAFIYTISVHIPMAGLALIPVIFKWPLILFPAHIVFLELVIDPACSIIFEAEPEDDDIMKRSPRGVKESMFTRKLVFRALLQGFGILATVIAVLKILLDAGIPEGEIRTIIFSILVVSNITLILSNKTSKNFFTSLRTNVNKPSRWIITLAVIFLFAVTTVPLLRSIFQFDAIHLNDLFIITTAGFVTLLWFESLKYVWKKRYHRSVILKSENS